METNLSSDLLNLFSAGSAGTAGGVVPVSGQTAQADSAPVSFMQLLRQHMPSAAGDANSLRAALDGLPHGLANALKRLESLLNSTDAGDKLDLAALLQQDPHGLPEWLEQVLAQLAPANQETTAAPLSDGPILPPVRQWLSSQAAGVPSQGGYLPGAQDTAAEAALKAVVTDSADVDGQPGSDVDKDALTSQRAAMTKQEAVSLRATDLPDSLKMLLRSLVPMGSETPLNGEFQSAPTVQQAPPVPTTMQWLQQLAQQQTKTSPSRLSGEADGLQPVLNTVNPNTSPSVAYETTQRSEPPIYDLKDALRSQQWEQNMAKQLLVMVKDGIQNAKLRIHPPQMGLIEVKLVLNQDQASVSFQSAHHAVREALETALPRLREMFNDQGLQLNQADVSSHGGKQRSTAQQDSQSSHGQGESQGEANEPEAETVMTHVLSGHQGLIDAFA